MLRPSLAQTGHMSELGLKVSCVNREPSVLTTKMSVFTTLLIDDVELPSTASHLPSGERAGLAKLRFSSVRISVS